MIRLLNAVNRVMTAKRKDTFSHSQRIYEMLHSKRVMENKKMEEECISGSSKFALLVKKEVKRITLTGYKKEFGLQKFTFIIK